MTKRPVYVVRGRKDRLALRQRFLKRLGFNLKQQQGNSRFGFASYEVVFPDRLSHTRAARVARAIVASSQLPFLRLGHVAERLFVLAGERPGAFGWRMRLKRRRR